MNRVKGIKEKLPFITAGDAVVRQLFKLQCIWQPGKEQTFTGYVL